MPEIVVNTTSNGHPVNLRGPLTAEIEQILARLAIAVAIFVRSVIPTMTTDQIIDMAERIKEMLPVEGSWKRCVHLYFENFVQDSSLRIAAIKDLKTEDELYAGSTVCGATWLNVAMRCRKSRAMRLVETAGYNPRIIDQLCWVTYFTNTDWWEKVARELRRHGHSEMAKVILADPYRGVIDEEQKLIVAVSQAAREAIVA